MDISSLGKTPVREDRPTGGDPSYEPEFEELEAEMEKSSSPSAKETTDWKKVVRLASAILSEKSKDLRVASRLAVARIQIDHIDGFADGVRLFADLIENFWDNLYPPKKRMRGRLGAMEWWLEKAESLLGLKTPEPMPAEKLDEIKNELKRLDVLFSEKVPDPPVIRSLQRFVESIPAIGPKVPEPAPEPEPEPTPESGSEGELSPSSEPAPETEPVPAAKTESVPAVKEAKPVPAVKEAKPASAAEKPPPATPSASSAPAPVAREIDLDSAASDQDAIKALKVALNNLERLGDFFRERTPMDPTGYRLTRIACWTTIKSPPPVVEENRTAIPAPVYQLKNTIEELQGRGNMEGLLNLIDGSIPRYPFWLDLNRMTAQALSGMGERYRTACDAVCMETANFLARVPGIERLAFQDGTAFADDDTKSWLKTLGPGTALSEAMAVVSSGGFSEREGRMTEIFDAARGLVQNQKVSEALSVLQKELDGGSSGKAKLLWRLGLCRILVEAKKARLAVPHLEKILKDIDSFHLEEWEPELALDGLRVAWAGFNAAADESYGKRIEEILDRIALLNPAEALRLASNI